jgi:hypothetical protein
MTKPRLCLILIASTALVLLSCAATQPSPFTPQIIPGFWRGLWHGFIAPLDFIISLFSNHVRIYAYPNSGCWYDFGFMLGIGGFSGGISGWLRKKKRRN